ncbi:hypothetical protein C8J57DRAFT_161430 [Mycena rebaudengoi]|nr:hypothetical protein C8J57DRAFT_161430 [Mycena rebaudengoi]
MAALTRGAETHPSYFISLILSSVFRLSSPALIRLHLRPPPSCLPSLPSSALPPPSSTTVVDATSIFPSPHWTPRLPSLPLSAHHASQARSNTHTFPLSSPRPPICRCVPPLPIYPSPILCPSLPLPPVLCPTHPRIYTLFALSFIPTHLPHLTFLPSRTPHVTRLTPSLAIHFASHAPHPSSLPHTFPPSLRPCLLPSSSPFLFSTPHARSPPAVLHSHPPVMCPRRPIFPPSHPVHPTLRTRLSSLPLFPLILTFSLHITRTSCVFSPFLSSSRVPPLPQLSIAFFLDSPLPPLFRYPVHHSPCLARSLAFPFPVCLSIDSQIPCPLDDHVVDFQLARASFLFLLPIYPLHSLPFPPRPLRPPRRRLQLRGVSSSRLFHPIHPSTPFSSFFSPSLRFLWTSHVSVVFTCPRAVRRLERRRAIRVGATCISVGARRHEDVVDRTPSAIFSRAGGVSATYNPS